MVGESDWHAVQTQIRTECIGRTTGLFSILITFPVAVMNAEDRFAGMLISLKNTGATLADSAAAFCGNRSQDFRFLAGHESRTHHRPYCSAHRVSGVGERFAPIRWARVASGTECRMAAGTHAILARRMRPELLPSSPARRLNRGNEPCDPRSFAPQLNRFS